MKQFIKCITQKSIILLCVVLCVSILTEPLAQLAWADTENQNTMNTRLEATDNQTVDKDNYNKVTDACKQDSFVVSTLEDENIANNPDKALDTDSYEATDSETKEAIENHDKNDASEDNDDILKDESTLDTSDALTSGDEAITDKFDEGTNKKDEAEVDAEPVMDSEDESVNVQQELQVETHLFVGAGTKQSPYDIASVDDWKKLGELVNGGESFSNTYFILKEDLQLEGDMNPIGMGFAHFSGILDGDKHVITVKANSGEYNSAPFGNLIEAVIKNLAVQGTINSDHQSVGSFSDSAEDTTFENCYSIADVYSTLQGSSIGGLVGDGEGCNFLQCFYYNENCMLSLSGNGGNAENSFYLGNKLDENSVGIAKTTQSFSNGQVTYLLNGAVQHRNFWKNTSTHPEFGDEETKPLYRVELMAHTENYEGVVVSFPTEDENSSEPVNEKYAPAGSILPLEVTWNIEPLVNDLFFEPENVVSVSEVDGKLKYVLTVPDSDIVTTYRFINDSGLDWYLNTPEEKNYTIYTERQLRGLASVVNGTAKNKNEQLCDDFNGKKINLCRDVKLNCQQYGDWIPIGNAEHTFSGIFDGKGHKVEGLIIGSKGKKSECEQLGFFGYCKGSVSNLTVGGEIWTSGSRVGGITGVFEGDGGLENCMNQTELHGNSEVGGIAGYFSGGTISNCENTVRIYSTSDNAGGIVGKCVNINATDCHNSGMIIAPNANNVGGLFGFSYGNLITKNCENSGSVQGYKNVGGVIGYAQRKVNYCVNKGAVIGDNVVGGIVGYAENEIWYSYNLGTITASLRYGSIGGFAGNCSYCYSFNLNNAEVPLLGRKHQVNSFEWHSYFYSIKPCDKGISKEGFLYGQTTYLLNDGAEHKITWKQSEEGYPVLGDSQTKPLYEIKLTTFGSNTGRKVKVSFNSERVVTNNWEQQIYLYEGDKIKLNVEWLTEEHENIVFFPEGIVQHDEEGYYIQVGTEDMDISYTVLENDETGFNWYFENPDAKNFLIHQPKQLYALAEIVNGTAVDLNGINVEQTDFTGKIISLASDITLDGQWTPIGSGFKQIEGEIRNQSEFSDALSQYGELYYLDKDKDNEYSTYKRANKCQYKTFYYKTGFNGTFCGNNFVISGLAIGSEKEPVQADYQGLFGYLLYGANVKNLHVTGAVYSTGQYVGGIAGYEVGNCGISTITNCMFGKEAESSINGVKCVGGICGFGNPENCSNYATIRGKSGVGGISGSGGAVKAFNYGAVSGENNVGGISGISRGVYSAVRECENSGNISGDKYVGGIFGKNENFRSIRQNTNKGIITGKTYVGGIGGETRVIYSPDDKNLDLFLNNNSGVFGESYVGGIFGAINCLKSKPNQCISELYNSGNIIAQKDAKGESYAGGITGYNETPISSNSVRNSGDVTAEGKYVGGVAGYMLGSMEADYYFSGVKECILNKGRIKGVDYVGGIAGYMGDYINTTKDITICNDGEIEGKNYVGGVIGAGNHSISCVRNSGLVKGENYVGGIAGRLEKGGRLKNSFSLSKVTAPTNLDSPSAVGSLAGEVDTGAEILGSFSYNTDEEMDVAGLNKGVIQYSCFLSEAKPTSAKIGIPLSADQFKNGIAAYILDGGDGKRSNIWTNGELYPIFAIDKPVYKISLKASNVIPEGCFVKFAQSDNYVILHDRENQQDIIYVLKDTPVIVETHSEGYVMSFLPKSGEKTNTERYKYIVDGNILIEYMFCKPLNPNYDWYTKAEKDTLVYEIQTFEELTSLANLVNGTAVDENNKIISPVNFAGKTIKLCKDIAMSGNLWTPIGSKETPFSGIFDGNGHSITNINLKLNGCCGIFGVIKGAKIHNLLLEGIVNSLGDHTGSFVAYAEDSTLTGCTSKVKVNSEGNFTGGIIGYGKQIHIEDCKNQSNVNGKDSVGGLIGWCEQIHIENCKNQSSVNGNNYVGGLIGSAKTVRQVIGCANEGEVSGILRVGGIAGDIGDVFRDTEIKLCGNSGTITAYSAIGGIIGSLSIWNSNYKLGQLSHCYNAGNITAFDPSGQPSPLNIHIGGIVGSDVSVSRCCNYGIIAIKEKGDNLGPLCAGKALNSNCYYLKDCIKQSLEDPSSKCMGEEAFLSGEVAYLMDTTGKTDRTYYWTQGTNGPIIAKENDNSVFKLTVQETKNGNTKADKNYVAAGNVVNITAIPDSNYMLELITVTDTFGRNLFNSSGKTDFKFTMAEVDATVQARFALKPKEGSFCHVILHAGEGKFLNGTNLLEVDVVSGQKLPEMPSRKGYDFEGWEVTSTPGDYFYAGQAVMNNMELTACWKEIGAVTVDFILNGGNGDAPAVQKLHVGDLIVRPKDPIRTGNSTESYVFLGWYTSLSGKKSWDFKTDTVQKTMTLYAHWKVNDKLAEGLLEDQPFVIENEAQLLKLAENVAAGNDYKDHYFSLNGDIMLNANWQGIGTKNTPFNGHFDGSGHTLTFENSISGLFNVLGSSSEISNLKINGQFNPIQRDIVGDNVFGCITSVGSGKIRQCKLNANINANEDLKYVGGLIGYLKGEVLECETTQECRITGVVNGSDCSSSTYEEPSVGGIVGCLEGDISRCTNNAKIIVNTTVVGGIVGRMIEGTVKDCTNNGMITNQALRESAASGIVGGTCNTKTNTINDCKNNGEICGNKAAGILGGYSLGTYSNYNTKIYIKSCMNYGEITAQLNGGGIVSSYVAVGDRIRPSANFHIDSCGNKGTIRGRSRTGGIVGNVGSVMDTSDIHESRGKSVISDCWNTGNVELMPKGELDCYGYGDSFGGIIGSSSDRLYVKKCWNSGDVTAEHFIGGIVGDLYQYAKDLEICAVERCYSTGNISGKGYDKYNIPLYDTPRNQHKAGYIGGIAGWGNVINSYWYGHSITITNGEMPTDVGCIVGARTGEPFDKIYVKNSYYVIPQSGNVLSDSHIEANAKPISAFISGEVAYYLDGGEKAHNEVWTQGEEYPIFGTPSIYRAQATVRHGSVSLSAKDCEAGTLIYVPDGEIVQVTVTPDSDNNGIDTKNQGRYELKSIIASYGNGRSEEITDKKTFCMNGDTSVLASFELIEGEELKPDKPVPDHGEGTGTGEGHGNGKGSGNGTGTGSGSGVGTGAGTGIGSEVGHGTGSGKQSGEGGNQGTDKETTVESNTSFANQISDQTAVQGQIDDVKHRQEGKLKKETLNNPNPEGGGGHEGGAGKMAEENKPVVLELMFENVKENPVIKWGILALLLIIIGMAGYRRYRIHKIEIRKKY